MVDENFVTLIYVSVILFIVFVFFGFWIQKDYTDRNQMSAYENCLRYCRSSFSSDNDYNEIMLNCYNNCNINNLSQTRINQECYFGNYVKSDSGWRFDLK